MHYILNYHGTAQKPTWNPNCQGFEPGGELSLRTNTGVFVFDNVLGETECQSLIEQFDGQETYPVGIDGYSEGDPARVGSHRAMAWAPELAQTLAPAFENVPEDFILWRGELVSFDSMKLSIPAPFTASRKHVRLGPTPWMRFMHYQGGGMHVPHYDASFHCDPEEYLTFFSWVLYLNTVPREHGGTFDFVDDGYRNHPLDRGQDAFADWTRMATDDEIILSVNPRRGRMLVFPHWLCHQVGRYTGTDHRYIIRGDLAYGYDKGR